MIVHVILNSHLDPVWLWKREQGIDEVLSTASSACDMLEDYPEIHITRGEAWFYETIKAIDPALFERIRKFVAAGRWHIVGGWYVQPDCNLASPETYRKHGEIGTAYFREKFGVEVKTGYNVDSFGHGAMLPSFYRSCGIENYIMMRPNKTELTLPANDFRWRAADGSEVLASRIIESYNSNWEIIQGHFEHTLAAANPELGHVMCFCGLGDHGGGPARIEIDWLLEHRHDWPGVEIRFSHPDAYFEAVRASGVTLPVFSGELQHHAVGCYAAESRIKREVRTAENALINAGRFLPDAKRNELWKKVLFATFHDVLAGSSIASAYPDLYDSLGHVRDEVNEATVLELRRRNTATPRCGHQRLFFDNLGDRDFSGMVECDPWLGFERWALTDYAANGVSLLDEQGRAVPFQRLPKEEPGEPRLIHRLGFELDIPRRGRRVLQLVLQPAMEFPGRVTLQDGTLSTGDVTAKCGEAGLASLSRNGRPYLAAPVELQVIDDPSDTWSHGLVGYPAEAKRTFVNARPWRPWYSGGLAAALGSEWNDAGASRATAVCRVEAGVPGVQLKFQFNWHNAQELVKLVLRPAFAVRRRIDGCPGGAVERRLNREEYPLFNFMTLTGDDRSLTLVSPDIFSADVQPDGTVRLTLLRSSCYAYSTDNGYRLPESHHYPVMDQGVHEYTLWLLPDAAPETVEREIYRLTQPVKFSESTVGMGERLTRLPPPSPHP